MNRTKEVIEVLKFGFAMQKAIIDSAADGKWTIMDYTNFLSVIPTVGPAVEGIGTVPGILATLTEDEKNEVMAYAAAEFDIPNDKLEDLIERTLDKVLGVVATGYEWATYNKVTAA